MWKREHLPNTRLRNVADVIDAPERLRLVAVNGQNIYRMDGSDF